MAYSNATKIVKDFQEQWKKDKDIYDFLGNLVSRYLKENISSTEILPEISYRTKEIISMIKTAIRKDKEYNAIYDKLGFRIITHFTSDIEILHKFIDKNFEILKYERKSDSLKFNEIGYLSDHYEVKLKKNIQYFNSYPHLLDIIFEIQLRTNCQHAWASVEHELVYKRDEELDKLTKRKILRLASLLEVCDDEFYYINESISSDPSFPIYQILKKIEGKFFKFAKMYYDKELSVYNIELLFTIFKSLDIISILQNIDNFINENETRISIIYKEHVDEIQSDLFLSQPEILLIWYLNDVHQYELINLWKKYYDISDLRELAIMWGKPLYEK